MHGRRRRPNTCPSSPRQCHTTPRNGPRHHHRRLRRPQACAAAGLPLESASMPYAARASPAAALSPPRFDLSPPRGQPPLPPPHHLARQPPARPPATHVNARTKVSREARLSQEARQRSRTLVVVPWSWRISSGDSQRSRCLPNGCKCGYASRRNASRNMPGSRSLRFDLVKYIIMLLTLTLSPCT